MLEELFELQLEAAGPVELGFKRYLYEQIDWNGSLFAIMGARGVGKTTLLLQHFKEKYASPEECLYVSADNIVVAAKGLFAIASEFFREGGKFLMIDEVHKYPDWSRETKNIHDSFPKGRMVLTGSSSLAITSGKGDLSRRLMIYQMRGLSFREYLLLETGISFPSKSLDEIRERHVEMAANIKKKVMVLKHFKNYLKHGYYPFYLEGLPSYHVKLNNVIEKVVSDDIPALFNVKPSSIPLMRKLVYLVVTSQPFVPNIERLSSQLGLSKEYAYHYLEYLENAGIFLFVYPEAKGLKLVRKPQKIYMENPNLFYAVLGKTGFRSEMGAIRESFFVNQLKAGHKVFAEQSADFIVDDEFLFEVGGQNKGYDQIRGKRNAFIVSDGIEVGAANRIPLWMMGFLY